MWVGGSRAYGLAGEDSDVDVRAVAFPALPQLALMEDWGERHMPDADTVLRSARKTLMMMRNGNPNLIELYGLPDDCMLHADEWGHRLLDVRRTTLRLEQRTGGGQVNWDWPSYWIGFATPFVIVAIVAVMVFVVSFAFEHPCGSECLPCDRTISENDCRIIRRVKELAHNLTPAHRRNHARWLREVLAGRPCPTPVFLDDRGSVAATFDGRHPVRIDGREVVRVFGNDVFLLDGMLVRLPGWWRDGDRLVVPDAAACGMIRAGKRGTVYPYMGVSVAVGGPDDGTIRIPMPSCRPWRGERARRKWIRETEDLICTQLDD